MKKKILIASHIVLGSTCTNQKTKNMKLSTTKDYLLFIGEEAKIKEGDYYYDSGDENFIAIATILTKKTYFRNLILAYYPLTKEAKELDLPLLPNPFNKQIDEVTHLKNLGNECFIKMKELNPSGGIKEFVRMAVEFGYKAAQSKQFSLEDMVAFGKKCFYKGFDKSKNDDSNCYTAWREESSSLIQSLSTQRMPKEFIPEYEYKCSCYGHGSIGCNYENNINNPVKRQDKCEKETSLKTLINSEGKQELVGTWKY